jgi:hypothetical protein
LRASHSTSTSMPRHSGSTSTMRATNGVASTSAAQRASAAAVWSGRVQEGARCKDVSEVHW